MIKESDDIIVKGIHIGYDSDGAFLCYNKGLSMLDRVGLLRIATILEENHMVQRIPGQKKVIHSNLATEGGSL